MAKEIGKDKVESMKQIWTLIPVLALAFACQNEQEAPETLAVPQAEEAVSVFYATTETADTKVYADEDFHIRWTADDRVSIFRRDTGNREYVFSGATGDNAGEFEEASTGTATGEALPYVYAVYPYAAGTTIGTDGAIAYTLPVEQAYGENTFGLGASPMVAVTEDQFLYFKNAGTFLVIQLYGNGVSVANVTLRGNKEEKLSGPATIQAGLDGDPILTLAGEGVSGEVRIHCVEPVALDADATNAKAFWFVLPPTTFEEGFTVTVEDSEGNIYEKSSSKKRTLARNHVLRMKAFELVESGFGIYPASGDAYVYDPSTDQMNIYEAEGSGWFRFLVIPDLKMYELGPIPLDLAQGGTFSTDLTVTTGGVQESSTSYDLKVLSLQDDGTLKLGTDAGDRFIIRF